MKEFNEEKSMEIDVKKELRIRRLSRVSEVYNLYKIMCFYLI